MPVSDIGATTTTAPGPSAMQQALGAGISAVGLYKGMQ
jgi:chromate transport protein ChrA